MLSRKARTFNSKHHEAHLAQLPHGLATTSTGFHESSKHSQTAANVRIGFPLHKGADLRVTIRDP